MFKALDLSDPVDTSDLLQESQYQISGAHAETTTDGQSSTGANDSESHATGSRLTASTPKLTTHTKEAKNIFGNVSENCQNNKQTDGIDSLNTSNNQVSLEVKDILKQ